MAAGAVFRLLVASLLATASRGLGEKSCLGEENCYAVAEEEVAELATPLLQTGRARQAQPSADAAAVVQAPTAPESAAGPVNASMQRVASDHTCITKNCECDDTVTCCYGTSCRQGWGGVDRCLFDSDPTDVSAQDPEKCVCSPPAGYGMGSANNASSA
ncbi:unnamed protein product [Prorocentrum cordatum]|uniref:Uncharacterized protein n=1 Tax=Prorocentrum cordatum TaxID=2364126 RepID=A0ABN9XJD3_9DINO|nr:unnamed protein product [Polarella glacialis]